MNSFTSVKQMAKSYNDFIEQSNVAKYPNKNHLNIRQSNKSDRAVSIKFTSIMAIADENMEPKLKYSAERKLKTKRIIIKKESTWIDELKNRNSNLSKVVFENEL